MKTSIVRKIPWLASFSFVLVIGMIVLACKTTSTFQPKAPGLMVTPTFPATSTAIPSPTPAYDVGSTIVSPQDGMKSMFVPAGEFQMGSQDGSEDEKPIHVVYLDSFWIDQTEITNSMYASCVKAGNCHPPFNTVLYEDPDFVDSPVDYVTWDDANAYCTWAGRRLPTEAEWEKAASWDDAEKEKRIYSWGNTIECSFANIYPPEGNAGNGCEGYPVKVGSYPSGASFYGALDMTGNVTEWVADLYDENYYRVSPSSNPHGPEYGKYHVLRGGSYLNTALEVRATARQSESFFNDWATFYSMVGFRCATNDSNSDPNDVRPVGLLWTSRDQY